MMVGKKKKKRFGLGGLGKIKLGSSFGGAMKKMANKLDAGMDRAADKFNDKMDQMGDSMAEVSKATAKKIRGRGGEADHADAATRALLEQERAEQLAHVGERMRSLKLHGGTFHTEVIMAKSGDGEMFGGIGVDDLVDIRWFRALPGKEFIAIEGVEGRSFYQPCIDDIGSNVCLKCELRDAGEDVMGGGAAFAEWGPVRLDPGVEGRVDAITTAQYGDFEVGKREEGKSGGEERRKRRGEEERKSRGRVGEERRGREERRKRRGEEERGRIGEWREEYSSGSLDIISVCERWHGKVKGTPEVGRVGEHRGRGVE